MPHCLRLVLLGARFAVSMRAGLLERLRVENDGSFALGEVWFRIQHFSPGWHCQVQGAAIAPGFSAPRDPGSVVFTGVFPTVEGPAFQFKEQLRRGDGDTVGYQAELHHAEGVPTEQLALGVFLPVEVFVGVPLELGDRQWVAPEEPFADPVVAENLTSLVLPVPEGRLIFTGSFWHPDPGWPHLRGPDPSTLPVLFLAEGRLDPRRITGFCHAPGTL